MEWKYRIVRYKNGDAALHQVAFDDDGDPVCMSESPAVFSVPQGVRTQEIVNDLLEALRECGQYACVQEESIEYELDRKERVGLDSISGSTGK